jgi:hypothetical protein
MRLWQLDLALLVMAAGLLCAGVIVSQYTRPAGCDKQVGEAARELCEFRMEVSP